MDVKTKDVRNNLNYKCCLVPLCPSTTISTPDKCFVSVPRVLERRKAWIKAIGRDERGHQLSLTSSLFCCEDHFNMEEDMTNFLRFRMVGGNLQAKSNVVPHIFDCQHQRSILKYVPRTATLKQNATRYLPAILESFSNSPRVTIEGEDMDKLMQSSYSAAINLAGSRSLIKQEPGENQEAQPDVGFVDMGSEPLKLSQVLEEDMDPLMLPGTFQTPNTVSQDLPCLPGPHCFKQEVLDDMKQEPPEMMQAGSTTSHGPLNADEDDYQMSILPEARSLNQDVEFHVKEEQTCLVDAREICSAELRNHPGSFFSSGKYGADSKSSVEGHKSTECDVDCAISHPPIDYVKNPSIKNVSTRAQSENEPSLGNPQPVCGEQEIYACDSCDSTFSGNDALVKHKTIDCDASVVGFTRTQHKRFNSGEKPFTCDTCDAKFSQSSDLRRHTRCHSGDRPFACDICQARFAQSSHLTAHSRSHSGDRPYACDLCSARFTQGSNLRRHQQSHSGEKPHACDICEARFTRSSHLAEHKRFHSGDKPYACDSCSARYTQKYYLTRHQKSHLEEKTHACDMCAARFAQNSNLVRHKRCHLGETSFVCHICQARFAKSAHLTRHKRSHFPKAKSHS